MHYVYILFSCKDKCLYTGFTHDLKTRFYYHIKGLVKATQHRRPLQLIYYESYINELDARKREVYLKSGKGKDELKIQLSLTLVRLKYKYLS